MGLGAWIESAPPELGVNTTQVKPINEGEQVTVVEDQPSSGGVWGFLDKLGDQATTGVGNLIKQKLQNEFDRQTYGPEKSADNSGDPRFGHGLVDAGMPYKEPFGEKYKTQLLIGAGLLGVVLVVSMARR